MNEGARIKKLENISVHFLAPVVPLKSIPKETRKERKRVLKEKLEKNAPEFYNKPIYKTKKYDLL